MPEDRQAIELYERVLGDFGTNAAGDLLRRWILGGFLAWKRDGGPGSLADALSTYAETYSNEKNTSSNEDDVSSNESDSGPVHDTQTDISPSPAKAAGFVGMLGMGLSQDGAPG